MKKNATILIAAVFFCSCSPGKKLLKDQADLAMLNANFEKQKEAITAAAISDYIKNNPCQPEPAIDLDSLCYLYYAYPQVGGKDSAKDYFPLATVTPGKLKTILVPWEDKRALQLLKDSIVVKDQRLAVANALASTKDAELLQAVHNVLEKQHGKFNTLLLVAVSLLLLAILIILILVRSLRKKILFK